MYMTEWRSLGTEPFEWQKRRMENLLSSALDRADDRIPERKTPQRKEKKIRRSPTPLRKIPGMAAL